jgi:stalled ribosome rescue protein Dom34
VDPDPDSVTLRILIRIENLDLDPGQENLEISAEIFSYLKKSVPLKRYTIALTTCEHIFDEKHRYFLFDLNSNFDYKKI